MHWVLVVLQLSCLVIITWSSVGLLWLRRCSRKFDALFAICNACQVRVDIPTWKQAIAVIDHHLRVAKEYGRKNPWYWYQHWNDNWLAEVNERVKGNEQPDELLN